MSNNNINLIISCPHCLENILIEQLNCCIFRHGVFKNNGIQIEPHSPKERCDHYIQNKLIYGCGKPFKIIKNENNEYRAIICDYI
jgi:hypothetical protein